MVFKCDGNIVIKAIKNALDYTEYNNTAVPGSAQADCSCSKAIWITAIERCLSHFHDLHLHDNTGRYLGRAGYITEKVHPRSAQPNPNRSKVSFTPYWDTSWREIQCVFTHGDLRPDNITVEPSDDYQFRVTGLLDWEYSGFYPEYYELIRSTNGLSPSVDNDWYLSYLSVFTRTLWHVVVTGLRSGGLRGVIIIWL
ncbi:hypothetical protein H112_05570 [Trichophyton rubrum D6]|uniref:Aminoglycoside phosphotransferase domain-containing protein n=3 Tax=Trichophyton TaxID=5550 RepID=F2SJU6_TRIRC|nr:uncharacterized protein TERG_03302 [Trichophyton rubrum CBS 118892]EZF16564.1 hypothetical protein H100_05588 [Trichophyton rubrum MR850]EZF40243.1 hypothetical protein H102_05555 [Trichophyton rubrum CBS 100081]EZF51068.1 hypothetical protein H103_05578 [Trichophyton rubrum CBS 288.86]EZF61468.1 hypothetical protein H104_05569 [Trichophyton rubrum CBS 289.86]EZF72230.1 hypothetical protein H105_05596 [Trichophyton soudanense CBS 452.61]EZF82889.1 hypothetical protein H110_05578 [Trichophy